MLKKRDAQGLSINVIIIVAIALIVLVVLIAIFTGGIGKFVSGVDAVRKGQTDDDGDSPQPACSVLNCFDRCCDGNVCYGDCRNDKCVKGNVRKECPNGCSGGVCK